MLIGMSRPRPDLEQVRRIKDTLRDALSLSEDATVTVTELACLEEGCPPIETVIGLLRPDVPQLQHKLHKPTASIDAHDLSEICKSWGFDAHISAF